MTTGTEARGVLFQLTGVGIVQVDLDTGTFVCANSAFCEMVGYSEAELRRMSYRDLTHPDDLGRDAADFEATVRGEREGGASVTRCLRKDGAVVWLELRVTTFRDGAHGPYNLAVVNDVTEHKRTEAERERLLGELRVLNETLEQRVEARTEALQRSERRFSQAFHAGPVAACITTLGRERFLEVNEAFSKLTGYSQQEVVGKCIFELGMWSSREDRETLERARRGGGGLRNLELNLRTKEGETRDILLSGEVIELGSERSVLKLFYDVTQRKRSETQLKQAIDAVMQDTAWFSRSVVERLAQLRSGKLNQASVTALTKRERQVLGCLARGMSNDAIARESNLAPQTVRNYVTQVYDKIGVRSRAEAVVWARERGLGGS